MTFFMNIKVYFKENKFNHPSLRDDITHKTVLEASIYFIICDFGLKAME